ncbi:MAG: hypothetical protein NWF09_08775 [Candidatus Bathyarchaeota archaeon]|nr:hypothetical protein [Candidatus Bathyarchaeota archaeon]
MKKTTLMLAVLSLVILLSFSLNAQTILAQEATYTIQQIDHQVEVLYSGHIIIQDTVRLSGQLTGDFLIGFPYKYGPYVLKGMAYDDDTVFQISLGVQLEGRSGFYGAKISFPQGAPQVFTVAFILSNNLVSQNSNEFTLDFPAYPSLVKDAARCNVTLILPEDVQNITITKNDGEVQTTSFIKENLAAFTYSPATATFPLSKGSIQIISVKQLTRQVEINAIGEITVSDKYRITNNSTTSISSLNVGLPLAASNVAVKDEFGRTLTTSIQADNSSAQFVIITLASPLNSGVSTFLSVDYTMLRASSEQNALFTLNFALYPSLNCYVDEVNVNFVLPEGARFLEPTLSSIEPSSSLIREVFQETLTINREGVSKIEREVPSEDNVRIKYEYNPLWASFRPTVWMWTLMAVGAVILAIWRRPKAAAPLIVATPKPSVILSPDQLRAFNDAYEEKSKLSLELKLIEERAKKGKIPRRRYKVQRKTLETRIETLNKNISELKALFRRAGGVYADLVRQLDIAETELVEIATNLRTIEVRYSRGELPLEEYKKAVADYQRRKEKAEATINGILLRLREELR